ncbi:MAG: sulfatase-like hydrolase/transferase [Pseudomonadales bacterium]|nr:sulfatase-like hydrolase/transferase [Pseudomonadales bacterium]
MPTLFYVVLAVPLFFSYAFSYEKNNVWIASSLASLLLCAWLLRCLAATGPAVAATRGPCLCARGGLILLALFQILRLLSFYFQGSGFNNSFFYHFEFTTALAAWRAYVPLVLGCALYLGASLALTWRVTASATAARPWFRSRLVLLAALTAALCLDPDLRGFASYEAQLGQAALREPDLSLPAAQELLAQRLDPAALSPPPLAASPGKNLVLIYLESLEATYFDQDRFGGDLLPHLRQWQSEALRFTDLLQADGTGFTMGGIVASQCGTPLLFEVMPNGNDLLNNGMLNRVACLGDILAAAGYQQTFLGGASLDFAGKGRFLEQHHYDAVLGREALQERLVDTDYQTGWGLYDDSLFGFAWDEFEQLAATGEPFNLTLLTLDTHHPEGHPSRSCAPFPATDNSILNAVYCSDQLLNDFLERLRAHPAWNNTVVALVSDHYAMRNDAQFYYPPFEERRLLFMLLNAGISGENARTGTLMDLAPTLLDVLGVRHNQAFLAGGDLLRDGAAPSWEELTALARARSIQQVNSRFFTTHEQSLCQSGAMLRLGPQTAQVAGQTLYLSEEGQPLPSAALGDTHALLALWDDAGFPQNSLVVPAAELPNLLYRYRQRNFLLLASAAALPEYMRERLDLSSEAGPQVVLGVLQGDFVTLPLYQDGEDELATSPVCDRLVNTIVNSVDEREEPRFFEQYCQLAAAPRDRLDTSTNRLYLSAVLYQGSWFEAELGSDAAGIYRPVQYAPLAAEPPSQCYAHVDDETGALIIPDLQVDEQRKSLRLMSVPGEELSFTLEAGQGGL